jgi:hypothetical protein
MDYGYNHCGGPQPRRERKLRLEAVTTCVDYSDFLAHTILFNKQCFDRWVVVTAPHDEATRRLCEYHDVEYVVTSAFYEDERSEGAHGHGRIYRPSFSKGKGINKGLEVLDRLGWVVHIDADVVLPPRARDMIEGAALDPTYLYGIDRLMAKDFDEWCVHLAYPEQQHDANIFIRANTFPFNVRVARHRDGTRRGGWLPIGFFQMWNPAVSGVHDYPTQHSSAARTDMQQGLRWDRAKRGLIPEIVAIHLESEEVRMGHNWEGRRTRFFGPESLRRHEAQHAKDHWL